MTRQTHSPRMRCLTNSATTVSDGRPDVPSSSKLWIHRTLCFRDARTQNIHVTGTRTVPTGGTVRSVHLQRADRSCGPAAESDSPINPFFRQAELFAPSETEIQCSSSRPAEGGVFRFGACWPVRKQFGARSKSFEIGHNPLSLSHLEPSKVCNLSNLSNPFGHRACSVLSVGCRPFHLSLL